MKPIKIAVRKIVEQVLQSGDIDNRYADSSLMLDGAKAHRRIQKSMGENYQKEVPLSVEVTIDGAPFIIHGRADGIIAGTDGGVTIDEIKTTTLPLPRCFEQHETHLGQAKCYAYMYMMQQDEKPDGINVQLTYYQLETGETKRYNWRFSSGELDAFFAGLLDKYSAWLKFEREWKETRNVSIKETNFPFPSYRKGQRELSIATYRTIEQGKKLYAQAPTGIGKTLSALFPSVKAVGEEKCGKIFYLTAKTVTRAVAEDAVRLMEKNGLRFKSVTLRAKEKICFCEEAVCNPDYCGYARGHYDRINEAVMDILQNNDLISPAVIEEYSRKHRVCPHEAALDTALWADLIICDYNHVFDPVVYLRRFFSDAEGSDYVFLVDEAHNLTDRVRDMYSAALCKSAFLKLKKELKDKNRAAGELKKSMGKLNDYMLDIRKSNAGRENIAEKEPDTAFIELVRLFVSAAEEWLRQEKDSAHEMHRDILQLYFDAAFFIGISEDYGEHYTTLTQSAGSELVITLFCLDPSQIIAQRLKLSQAAVMFSATLTPLPYYRETLGGNDGDYILSLPSPFERGRLLLAANYGISTKYKDREESYVPIADCIYETVSKRRGNYLAYFPSYEYMRRVYDVFCEKYGNVNTLLQQSGMKEEERADFLSKFDAENGETLIGFCVLGGIFSEGIDLTGERLIGSIIVGVGLPKISFCQDLIKDYFNKKNGLGFDYAYVFPGMNKVLQAAGRVIRTPEDFGVGLLIDSRFNTPRYRSLYPPHWSEIKMIKNTGELAALINDFIYFKS